VSQTSTVGVPVGELRLTADLTVPAGATGVVVVAHGSGSGRASPRNVAVARVLWDAGIATLLVDLLTPEEDEEDRRTRRVRFDVRPLGERVAGAVDWLAAHAALGALPVGLFGASTGAAAALIAAAARPDRVRAVVSRGGRPDLAGADLPRVRAATLLVVGALDPEVLELNRAAAERLAAETHLEVVPGAGHLFSEPGALETVAELTLRWFQERLRKRR
jgi:dienelactone hydrolase